MLRPATLFYLVAALTNSGASATQECPGALTCIPEQGGKTSWVPAPFDSLTPQSAYDYILLSESVARDFYAPPDNKPELILIRPAYDPSEAEVRAQEHFSQGLQLLVARKACAAAQEFHIAAVAGHRYAQLAMAHAFLIGAGVSASDSLASDWYTIATRFDARPYKFSAARLYFQYTDYIKKGNERRATWPESEGKFAIPNGQARYSPEELTSRMAAEVNCNDEE